MEWLDIEKFWDESMVWLWEKLYGGFVSILEAIPAPSFANNVDTLGIPEGVAWFASALELPAGAAIMGTAWTIRFVIRRLPVVG
jgi:hypothetical protein